MAGLGLKDKEEEQSFRLQGHSFHSILRLLAEAHDLEVSALQSKVAELERSAGHGRGSAGKCSVDATVQTDGGRPPISPPSMSQLDAQGTPQSGPPGVAEPDRHPSEGRLLRETYRAVRTMSATNLSQRSCPAWAVTRALRVVHWRGFDACVGLIICVNAVCIGIDLEFSSLQRPKGVLPILETVFLVVYSLELALRVLAHGRMSFRDNWVKFDAALLFVGFGSELVRLVAATVEDLDKFIVIRMLRLLRIFRAARMMARQKPLRKLVSGFLGSMETLSSTFLALSLAVYVFSCLSMEFIALDDSLKANSAANATIHNYYGGFPATVMTTFQFVTMDSTSAIYRPLIEAQPLLAVFFPLIFAILPILLMNLVTAIIVDDAITSSQMDAKTTRLEMKRKCKALEPEIRRVFHILDADGDGQLRMPEVVSADFAGIVRVDGLSQLLTPQVLLELYDVLDVDSDGFISEDEFVNGLIQLALSEASLDITEVKHLVKANSRYVRSLKQDVERILVQVGGTLSRSSSTASEGSWQMRL